MIVVYATIWIAMILFVAGETGRALTPRNRNAPRWAAWTFLSGSLVAIIHSVLAIAVAHDWDHGDAVRTTSRLTRDMYGVDFDQALYMNYVFLAVWLADAIWWLAAPPGYVRPAAATWSLRGFYMVFLFNAMVVFAHDWRRFVGLAFVTWLARIWAPGVLQRASGRAPS